MGVAYIYFYLTNTMITPANLYGGEYLARKNHDNPPPPPLPSLEFESLGLELNTLFRKSSLIMETTVSLRTVSISLLRQ